MDRNRLDPYGWEPEPLNGAALLPNVMPREMRTNPLGQGNLVDRALSSFGQPSLDALRQGMDGKATPQEIARTFLETGPVGPFGMARGLPTAVAVAERPISAAIRYRGEIFRGTHHADAVAEAVKKYGQHAHDELFESANLHDTNGFVTNTGRFLTRDEAHKLMQQRGHSDHDQANPLYTRSFEDQSKGGVEILRKYGIAGPVATGVTANALSGETVD